MEWKRVLLHSTRQHDGVLIFQNDKVCLHPNSLVTGVNTMFLAAGFNSVKHIAVDKYVSG